eukprot:COSAG05_NODE_2136_length_3500_cov_13.683622_5_plen_108_part_00
MWFHLIVGQQRVARREGDEAALGELAGIRAVLTLGQPNDRAWALQPWSREMVAAADAFASARQQLGFSGRFWFSFGWVDDNSFVSLRVLTALATKARYDVWQEIVWV